jgi:hypothetical protein
MGVIFGTAHDFIGEAKDIIEQKPPSRLRVKKQIRSDGSWMEWLTAEMEPLTNEERCRLMRGEEYADDVTPDERFGIEWEELLDLYRVATNERALHAPEMAKLAAHASQELAKRMRIFRLGSIEALMALTDPKAIVDALAPREILRSARKVDQSASDFGPAVTAETPDEFEEIVEQYRARIGATGVGGYLSVIKPERDAEGRLQISTRDSMTGAVVGRVADV